MWKASGQNLGLEIVKRKHKFKQKDNDLESDLEHFCNLGENDIQSFTDGKLEVMTYAGHSRFAMEKVLSGNSHKVHQGRGCFEIEFKDTELRVYH